MTNTLTAAGSIAFYTIGDRTMPSTRFRVLQYLPGLARLGFQTHHFGLPVPNRENPFQIFDLFWCGRLRASQLREAGRYDLLFVQKGLSSWRCRGLFSLLQSAGKPYVVDLDDAVYEKEHAVRLPGILRKLQNAEEPGQLIRHAAHVIAGNAFLADFVSRYHSRVTILPTPVDTERFSPSFPLEQKKEGRPIVLGWSGTAGTNFYLNPVLPVLRELAEKYPLKFLVISNTLKGIQISELGKTPFEFIPWSLENETANLAKIDIGLMPLRDDAWSRGKCGFKVLLYMAMGIPAVCSPVGMNQEIVEDGKNGFLALTREEWAEKLARLINDPHLCFRMGAAGRKCVEEKYSLAVMLPKLALALERSKDL